jgi:hypothetical protein
MLGRAGLQSTLYFGVCAFGSARRPSLGPPNRRRSVRAPHDRLAESVRKVPLARPARGVAVRSKDGATQENICGQYWVSSGTTIRMDCTFGSGLQQAIQIKGWAAEVEVEKQGHRLG